MPSKFLYPLVTILLCYIGFLYVNDQLTLYIHPRYTLFTVLFCVTMAILLAVSTQAKNQTLPKTSWLLLPVVCIALGFAPSSLSAELASSRSTGLGATPPPSASAVDVFSTDLTRFSVRDWDAYLRSNPDPATITGKQARVEGFLYTANNQLYVARYQLTCCAVDATPLVLPLVQDRSFPESGKWVRVSGKIVHTPEASYPLQLAVEQIEEIPEPKDPYVF